MRQIHLATPSPQSNFHEDICGGWATTTPLRPQDPSVFVEVGGPPLATTTRWQLLPSPQRQPPEEERPAKVGEGNFPSDTIGLRVDRRPHFGLKTQEEACASALGILEPKRLRRVTNDLLNPARDGAFEGSPREAPVAPHSPLQARKRCSEAA